MIISAATVLTLLIPSTLVGWGSEGHEFVALLAETRLTENTKKGICSLIGDARRGLRLVRDEGDGRVTHFPASQTIALGGS